MFTLLRKDPIKKLEREYEKISSQAVNAQRNGNIDLYSQLSQEADGIAKEIDKLRESESLNS